jgi:hypothetical protein
MTTKRKTAEKRARLEELAGVLVTHRRGFDAAGNNVLGWYALHPCKEKFLGRTLDEAIAKLTADIEQQRERVLDEAIASLEQTR